MRWIFLLLVALAFGFDTLHVMYWRQSDAIAGSSGLALVTMLLLPFVIVLLLYAIYRLFKWRKHQRELAEQQAADQAASISQPIVDPLAPWLYVHQSILKTALGDQSAGIVEQLQTLARAPSDPILYDQNGVHPPSRRMALDLYPPIDPLPEWHESDDIEDEHHTPFISDISEPSLKPLQGSDRAQRIQAILISILVELDQSFTLISEKMTQSQIMTKPLVSQGAVLHPAWTGQAQTNTSELPKDPKAQSTWSRVSLRLQFLLPRHLDDAELSSLQQMIASRLNKYAFKADVDIQYSVLNDVDGSLDRLIQDCNALAEVNQPQLLLLVGADSTLDQHWLNQQTALPYVPAEGGFAMLLSNQTCLAISRDLPILSHLSAPLWSKRHKAMSSAGKIEAEELITLLADLSRIYKISEHTLVLDTGVLLTDTRITTSQNHATELSKVINKLDINNVQIAYVGGILEHADILTAGMTLAVAVDYAKQSNQPVPVLCSAGEHIRSVWLAIPTKSDVEGMDERDVATSLKDHEDQ